MAFLRLVALVALVLALLKLDNLRTLPFAAAPSQPSGSTYHLDLPSALALRSRGAVVIDARDRPAYERGHIAGAINLPISDRETGFPALRPNLAAAPGVVVYCDGGSCELAQQTAAFLSDRGIPNVSVYRGGYNEWYAAGLPVETTPSHPHP